MRLQHAYKYFVPLGAIVLTIAFGISSRHCDAQSFRQSKLFSAWVWQLSYSQDGRQLAGVGLGSNDRNTYVLCDAASLRRLQIREFSTNGGVVAREGAVSLSLDAHILAAASVKRGWLYYVRFYDANSKRLLYTRTQDHRVYSLAFSPKGNYIASSTPSDSDSAWRVYRKKGQPPFSILMSGRYNSDDFVSHMSFSKDERLFVAGTWSGTLQVWSTRARRLLHTLKYSAFKDTASKEDGKYEVTDIAIPKAGEKIVSLHGNGALCFWDLKSEKLIATRYLSPKPTSISFSPNGKLLAVGNATGGITFYQNVKDAAGRLRSHQNAISAMCFAPNGTTLAIGYKDGTVALWRIK